ncbi:Aca2/YdiL-like domain-containing protein [Nevskia sp.]|uniref:Aca2/YdiL-like domain-containing protein n=1 Tax=Nevskia sp. TaxID=1929292 RepID=UPI003F7172D8
MNSRELQACRKVLMLDVSEAAEWVGGVSPRSWQYWESGRSEVPVDVERQINDLLAIRLEMMNACDEKLANGEALTLPFFPSLAQYQAENPDGTPLGWRLSQSVAALYFAEGHAQLI